MDPKSFYGLSTKFISKIPNDGNASDHPDMLDDETASTSRNMRNTVYASDSENERDNGKKVHVGMIIPESESEEEEGLDDVPLQQRLDRITSVRPMPVQTKRSLPNWSLGNMIKDEEGTKFIASNEMPMDLMLLSTPIQYFKFFMTREILKHTLHQSTLYSVQQCP